MMDRNIDLVSLPKKSFWKLSDLMIAFCVFDAVYRIIDMQWVSSISYYAFFAMGISVPIIALIFSFVVSIGMGTNSIMSGFIGLGNYDNAYNSLIHGILFSVVVWIFVMSVPFSVFSSKMRDGFGKSPYSLLFTLLKIIVQIRLIYSLDFLFSRGDSVLVGIMLSEVIFALVYYVFLKYIFKTMDKQYENRKMVMGVS